MWLRFVVRWRCTGTRSQMHAARHRKLQSQSTHEYITWHRSDSPFGYPLARTLGIRALAERWHEAHTHTLNFWLLHHCGILGWTRTTLVNATSSGVHRNARAPGPATSSGSPVGLAGSSNAFVYPTRATLKINGQRRRIAHDQQDNSTEMYKACR